MVAAPLTFDSEVADGLRPLNLRTDVPQVLTLLDQVFRPDLESEGQFSLSRMSIVQQPWVFLRLRELADGIRPGFVWEANRRIVGNVSLLSSKAPGRFLVANVAVHPSFRRRGIARQLMLAAIEEVSAKGVRELMLQVKHDNDPAINLYASLGFKSLGSMTSWYARHGQIRRLPVAVSRRASDEISGYALRPLRDDEWRMAYRLDQEAMDPIRNWPEPLPFDAYRMNFWRRLQGFLGGRRSETWALVAAEGQVVGLGTILAEWGRTHALSVRVRPEWQGQVERILVGKLMRRVQDMPRRPVRIDHPLEDEVTGALLREAGFRDRRRLTLMRLEI